MSQDNKIEMLKANEFFQQENNKKEELIKDNIEPKEEGKEEEKAIIEVVTDNSKTNENQEEEDDETKKLIEKEEKEEKKRLVDIIDRLKEDLDSEEYQSLGQIYEQYLNNEDMTKRKIKPGTTRKSLCAMFYFVSPLFCIINLMGVFQSISMLKIISEILKNALKNYFKSLMNDTEKITKFSLNDYIKQYEYYSMFNNNTKKEAFDFNLTMVMACIGDAFLKAKGFRISYSVLSIINIAAIILILNFSFEEYDRDDNTFTIFKMLFMLLIWLLLFIGVGGSALLSQQIIIDSNYKYDEYIKILNEESKKKLQQKKDKMKQSRQEKGKYKEKKTSDFSNELKDVKDIGLDQEENDQIKSDFQIKIDDQIKIDAQEEKEIKNNEQNKFSVNPEISLEYDVEKKIKKQRSQEINIKEIAEDFDIIRKNSENLNKTQTLTDTNILSKKKEINKKFHKKKSIKKENEEKKNKNKFNSFFMICITTILGYFLKYIVNISLIGANTKNDKYMEDIANITDHNNKDGKKCNKTDYDCVEKIYNDHNLTITNSMLFEDLIRYISKEDIKNKPLFYIIAGIYIGSSIFSIILYSVFVCIFTKNKKEKNIKGDTYSVCEICGYTMYSEDIILNKPPCCECCQLLCCGTCQNCLNMIIGSVLCCLNEKEKNEINICGCCKCCDREKIDYKKNKEFFCYCYQAKRQQNWFNKFLTSDTQKKIFPYMLEYFYLQFLTIAFEYQNNQFLGDDSFSKKNIEKEKELYIIDLDDLNSFGIFIVTFFLFFYSTLSFNTISSLINNKNEKKSLNVIKQISEGILAGAHGILIFNSLFSLIVSALYLSKKYDLIFEKQHLISVPILMNKFYYFTLIFFCVSFSDEKKKFEVISGSTLISIYLSIWDLIISLIRDHSSLKALYIVQTVFSSLPSLAFLIFLLTIIFYGLFACGETFKDRFELYFCLFSFCLCFGGFWFNEERYEKLLARNCECCEVDCYYCFECCNYCSCDCCYCCDCIYCCECCTCCECYDCCGCCDCFYCCGDECSCNC